MGSQRNGSCARDSEEGARQLQQCACVAEERAAGVGVQQHRRRTRPSPRRHSEIQRRCEAAYDAGTVVRGAEQDRGGTEHLQVRTTLLTHPQNRIAALPLLRPALAPVCAAGEEVQLGDEGAFAAGDRAEEVSAERGLVARNGQAGERGGEFAARQPASVRSAPGDSFKW